MSGSRSPPPPYNVPPETWSSRVVHPSTYTSEETPLIHQTQRKRISDHFIWSTLIYLIVLFVILVVIIVYGVCLRDNIAIERRRWEEELVQRRLDEKSRIYKWEVVFNVTRERHRHQIEKWHREEEDIQRLGLHWDEPVRHPNCAGYNTREYWAQLLNTVPFEYNWTKACEDIPIVIHGRSVKAFRCYSNPNVAGEVYGHWLVDFNEPLCTPFWDQFEDKGCTAEGSGRRRFLAHLVNIHDEQDGEKLCASTPIDFHGKHFNTPKSCVNWGRTGIYGFWEIEDSNC